MAEKRCMGCMRPISTEVCPHCGYREGTPNAAHQLAVGSILQGKYVVGKALGQGGFGITYAGWDNYLEMAVAIKEYYPGSLVTRNTSQSTVLHCSMARMEPVYNLSKERFLREARALSKFDYVREIVHFGGFFQQNNTAYIVMEFIRGIDLVEHVKRCGGKLTMAQTMQVLGPVMDALAAVHEDGLVHRDISPDNIMLLEGGGVKLLDFGAVREVAEDVDHDLTKSTEAILKQGFAPMEQYRSRGNLGPWTDVYALCATFYFCLTGKVPEESLTRMMGDGEVDWGTVPDLSPQQRQALEKGMALRAQDRWQSMRELRQALNEGEAAAAPKKKKKTWVAVAAAVLALAVGGGALALAMSRKDAPVELASTPTAAPVTQPVQTEATTEPLVEETAPLEQAQTLPPETVPTEPELPTGPWQNNIMRQDLIGAIPVTPKAIHTITFLSSLDTAPENCWDVSQAGDGSVVAWSDGWNAITVAGEGGIMAPESCKGMFRDLTQVTDIRFGSGFHTEHVTDFSEMFSGCSSLVTVDAQSLDVRSAENISRMFYKCIMLKSLDLQQWDVSRVETMSQMFNGCEHITFVNATGWNCAAAVDMYEMFAGCWRMKNMYATDWQTPVLEDVRGMFDGCSNLDSIDVSSWYTGNITDMSRMFYGCASVMKLKLNNWDVSRVRNFDAMFSECSWMVGIELDQWDTSRAKSMNAMFSGCSRLRDLEPGSWNVSGVTNMREMFRGCYFSHIDVAAWDVSSVTDMSYMFSDCKLLAEIDVSRWDVSSVKDVSYMFNACAKSLEPDITAWNVSNISNSIWFLEYDKTINGFHWATYFK